jgi:hypothetical protein
MELYSKLIINFTEFHTDHINLSEEEWNRMIMGFCIKLAEKPAGRILIEKLTGFVNDKYHIKVANYDTELKSSCIYPKIRYQDKKSILIIIPSVPYFVKVEVLKDNDFNYLPVAEKLSSSGRYEGNKANLIQLERLPQIIGFAHELIHCLRYFEGINTSHPNEEEHTIYGIESNTLSYNINGQTVYITENTIRKDFGFKPRMSHYSSENYCWGLISSYKNSTNFTKEDFFN